MSIEEAMEQHLLLYTSRVADHPKGQQQPEDEAEGEEAQQEERKHGEPQDSDYVESPRLGTYKTAEQRKPPLPRGAQEKSHSYRRFRIPETLHERNALLP